MPYILKMTNYFLQGHHLIKHAEEFLRFDLLALVNLVMTTNQKAEAD